MPEPLKIAFFGLPLAACLLAQDGHDLVMAVLSPVEGPGRRRLHRLLGSERIIDARTQADLNARIEQRLTQMTPDLIVSWFWTRLIPVRWLQTARYGGIGAHPSLLPRHRGPNPFFWAIDSGDVETGVTLHTLSSEYDTGDILLTRKLPIGDRNAWQLARALDRPSLSLLREAASRFASGAQLPRTPQRHELASWANEPEGDLLRADFHWPTERVLRRIRALSPVPGLALEVAEIKFFVTQAVAASVYIQALEPGEAAIMNEPKRLIVRTADGAIQVERAIISDDEEELRGDELAALAGQRLAELDRIEAR